MPMKSRIKFALEKVKKTMAYNALGSSVMYNHTSRKYRDLKQ